MVSRRDVGGKTREAWITKEQSFEVNRILREQDYIYPSPSIQTCVFRQHHPNNKLLFRVLLTFRKTENMELESVDLLTQLAPIDWKFQNCESVSWLVPFPIYHHHHLLALFCAPSQILERNEEEAKATKSGRVTGSSAILSRNSVRMNDAWSDWREEKKLPSSSVFACHHPLILLE